MDSYHSRLFRWFILLWLGLIYLWGLRLQGIPEHTLALPEILLFTILMIIHIVIHWFYLSDRFAQVSQSRQLLMCILQSLLALGLCILIHEWDVTMGLYLTLILETSVFQNQTRVIAIGTYITSLLLATFILYVTIPHELGEALRGFAAPIFVFAVSFTVLYLQQVHAREQAQKLLKDLEIAHAQLSAYALHVEKLTLTTERQRMARELHDTLVQGLAGLAMQLEVTDRRLTNQRYEPAQNIIQQAMVQTRETLAEARSAIYDLRMDVEHVESLTLTVQEKVARFSRATGIACSVDLNALSLTSSTQQIHVLRVITEGLANIARHAQAQHAWIRAICTTTRDKKQLLIEIRDNGKGFDPTVIATQVGHYGLLGLRERAHLIGGCLDVESKQGQGTVLRFQIPLEQKGALDE
ncbi:sensor histidine kinase [Ktedonobacter racemifer]|uniref:Integral membrane sensor signal transduction histidine kinase n=1 Tax=Ktedonobacter racemifer DSM 44963 TaxID=485913 RepID=D6TQX8_KTERA|nr:sensor histidine kinase [Ktedonobacter racemifer]EFH85849.1 integral membrane sensor signal transduction histidine kinase [Ktedonobacter racemifer DSM 44963]